MPVRKGHCSCNRVKYSLRNEPLIVHACHCLDCQRITGSAFVINIWTESENVEHQEGNVTSTALVAGDGSVHEVFFCAACGAHMWSRYHATPGNTLFVRAGTLEKPETIVPDVHIFTRSKVPWLSLPEDTCQFEAFYNLKDVWPEDSLLRLRKNMSSL